jgi:hypothetical protein
VGRVREEVAAYEERLRLAELGPTPSVFEDLLDDNAMLVEGNAPPARLKAKVVQAHQPGNGPVFSTVQMSQMQIIEHGESAVVTCRGTYVTEGRTINLKFMRVWVKKNNHWKIVAGTVSR